MGGKKQMATLKDNAIIYESPAKTKNIADLQRVSTDLEVESKEAKTREGESFTIQYVTVDGEQYRVPQTVFKSLKLMLEDNPNLKEFKVKKTGVGLETEYTVIPLL